ncbi:single-stranded DNA-binding protein [Allokutzneria sp. A3M-2-11 16]|uniref:single-stranded DNA-binding protein n=1 Tax=Allokutzneria sp. A3M-2-11 16 TaxID=2962043 RepID=UPI0020B7ABF7|nr:single-stranded DNA-binding protein [Allokutzneria sp. A3M-2-11 16]MCP3800889.1 single-stranded DNA-binding protein [Allokutzneria sp. A3M-2-11 16]
MHDSKATVIGNVVNDPQSRTVKSGACVVSFRVASNRRRLDRASGEWVDSDPLFLSVQCWGELGAGVAYSLRKGDPVIVTGRLRTREWEAEGQRRSVVELDAEAVGPDLARSLARVQRVHRAGNGDAGAAPEPRGPRDDAGSDDSVVPEAAGSLYPV